MRRHLNRNPPIWTCTPTNWRRTFYWRTCLNIAEHMHWSWWGRTCKLSLRKPPLLCWVGEPQADLSARVPEKCAILLAIRYLNMRHNPGSFPIGISGSKLACFATSEGASLILWTSMTAAKKQKLAAKPDPAYKDHTSAEHCMAPWPVRVSVFHLYGRAQGRYGSGAFSGDCCGYRCRQWNLANKNQAKSPVRIGERIGPIRNNSKLAQYNRVEEKYSRFLLSLVLGHFLLPSANLQLALLVELKLAARLSDNTFMQKNVLEADPEIAPKLRHRTLPSLLWLADALGWRGRCVRLPSHVSPLPREASLVRWCHDGGYILVLVLLAILVSLSIRILILVVVSIFSFLSAWGSQSLSLVWMLVCGSGSESWCESWSEFLVLISVLKHVPRVAENVFKVYVCESLDKQLSEFSGSGRNRARGLQHS